VRLSLRRRFFAMAGHWDERRSAVLTCNGSQWHFSLRILLGSDQCALVHSLASTRRRRILQVPVRRSVPRARDDVRRSQGAVEGVGSAAAERMRRFTVTCCGARSRRTCWNPGGTFGPCRSCCAIPKSSADTSNPATTAGDLRLVSETRLPRVGRHLEFGPPAARAAREHVRVVEQSVEERGHGVNVAKPFAPVIDRVPLAEILCAGRDISVFACPMDDAIVSYGRVLWGATVKSAAMRRVPPGATTAGLRS